MSAEGDDSLIDYLRPQYRFAEFLCYANALLRGVDAKMHADFLPGGCAADDVAPWQFRLRPEAVLDILGVVLDAGLDEMNRTGADTAGLVARSAFDKHATLKMWLESPVPEAAF